MKQRVTIGVLWLVAGGASCIGHPSPAPQPEWGVALLEVGSSRDAQQEQTALRDCLELLGIPYVATSDVVQAARRPLIFAGGILTNTQLTPSQRETLYSYVERGGVLLSTQVQGNKFFPLFGIAEAATSRTNFRLLFTGSDDPVLRYLNRPDERDISLGDPTLYSETVWSTEYTPRPGTQVLARYANGKAALTVNTYGRGLAYALGLGFKETTLIPRLARGFEAARHWINWFSGYSCAVFTRTTCTPSYWFTPCLRAAIRPSACHTTLMRRYRSETPSPSLEWRPPWACEAPSS